MSDIYSKRLCILDSGHIQWLGRDVFSTISAMNILSYTTLTSRGPVCPWCAFMKVFMAVGSQDIALYWIMSQNSRQPAGNGIHDRVVSREQWHWWYKNIGTRSVHWPSIVIFFKYCQLCHIRQYKIKLPNCWVERSMYKLNKAWHEMKWEAVIVCNNADYWHKHSTNINIQRRETLLFFCKFNIFNILNSHLSLVPHICSSESGQHWFR